MFGLFISRRSVVCGQFRSFAYAQGVDGVLPGDDLIIRAGRQWTPQHFPNVHTASASFYTSNPHPYAQQTDKKSPAREAAPLTVSRTGTSCGDVQARRHGHDHHWARLRAVAPPAAVIGEPGEAGAR